MSDEPVIDMITVRCPDCGVVMLRLEQLSTLPDPDVREIEEKCRQCRGEAA